MKTLLPTFCPFSCVTGHVTKRNHWLGTWKSLFNKNWGCLTKGFIVDLNSYIFKTVNQHRVASSYFIWKKCWRKYAINLEPCSLFWKLGLLLGIQIIGLLLSTPSCLETKAHFLWMAFIITFFHDPHIVPQILFIITVQCVS